MHLNAHLFFAPAFQLKAQLFNTLSVGKLKTAKTA
jgi:hypothetical protein